MLKFIIFYILLDNVHRSRLPPMLKHLFYDGFPNGCRIIDAAGVRIINGRSRMKLTMLTCQLLEEGLRSPVAIATLHWQSENHDTTCNISHQQYLQVESDQ